MTMNSRERVLCALAGEQPDRVPFCEGTVAQNVVSAMTGVQQPLSERQISDALGRDVVMANCLTPIFADREVGSDGQAFTTTGWIKTRADLERMVFPDAHDPLLYKQAQQVLDEKGERATVAQIKLGVAPMLVSMGLDGFAFALKDDPWLVREVLRRYVDWQLEVTAHFIGMGFDFMWAFDDIAYKTGLFCSKAAFREFLLPAFQRSAEAITLPWIYHSDGNIMAVLDDLLALGMRGIHPIEPGPMDLGEMKAQWGKKVCLIGNVSIDLLGRGTPEEVTENVRQCIRVGAPGGGYMISSCNSIPPYARPENVRAMADAIRKYGAYNIHGDKLRFPT